MGRSVPCASDCAVMDVADTVPEGGEALLPPVCRGVNRPIHIVLTELHLLLYRKMKAVVLCRRAVSLKPRRFDH